MMETPTVQPRFFSVEASSNKLCSNMAEYPPFLSFERYRTWRVGALTGADPVEFPPASSHWASSYLSIDTESSRFGSPVPTGKTLFFRAPKTRCIKQIHAFAPLSAPWRGLPTGPPEPYPTRSLYHYSCGYPTTVARPPRLGRPRRWKSRCRPKCRPPRRRRIRAKLLLPGRTNKRL